MQSKMANINNVFQYNKRKEQLLQANKIKIRRTWWFMWSKHCIFHEKNKNTPKHQPQQEWIVPRVMSQVSMSSTGLYMYFLSMALLEDVS
jgi:hypothetical protein